MTARGDSADYGRIFLGDAPLLDTRAPLEYQRGAFPTSHNLPLMSDAERAAVGTCYKNKGQEAAIELGHELVAGPVRDARVADWAEFAKQHPEGYLYCFRGGLRSQIVQQWLRDAGIEYPRVTGGYKAMRRYLLDRLEEQSRSAELVLVAGATGTGKTRLLQRLSRVVDLEGIARHRGSAFGRLLEEQPTQIDFENAIAIALLKLAQAEGPVILEDEGRLIGRLALPESLRLRMISAPYLLLEYSLEDRVQVVYEDYIEDLGQRFVAAHGDAGRGLHRERLLGDLARTKKRLGGERYREIVALMEAAFAAPAPDDAVLHREWITRMLRDYYDPMYAYQLSQREGRCLCQGDRDQIAEFVAAQVDAGQ